MIPEGAFGDLQRWCVERDAAGQTPRLVIDFEAPHRQISYRDEDDGPVVRMGPATYRMLRDTIDARLRPHLMVPSS